MPKDITHKEESDVRIDVAMLREFRDAAFKRCDPDETIPLRIFGDEGGVSDVAVAKVGGPLDPIVEMAESAAARRYTFCPPIVTSKRGWHATESDIESAPVATVEIDRNPKSGSETIIQILGRPSIRLYSGGIADDGEPKVHLHYRLKRPAKTREEVLKLKRLRAMMAHAADADRTSITPVHPLRWGGSIHAKGAPKLAVATFNDDVEIDLDEAIALMIEAGHDVPIEIDFSLPAHLTLLAPSANALREIVEAIPNEDLEWGQWNELGMAIHAACGGSRDFGFALFTELSERSGKFNQAATELRWKHYAKSPADKIGYGYLVGKSKLPFGLTGIEEARERLKKRREESEKAPALSPLEEEMQEADEAPRTELTAEERAGLQQEMAQEIFNSRQGRESPIGAKLIADEAARTESGLWKMWLEAQDNCIKLSKFRLVVEQAEALLPPEMKAFLAAEEGKTEEEEARQALETLLEEGHDEGKFELAEGGDTLFDMMPDCVFKDFTLVCHDGLYVDSQEVALMAALMVSSAVCGNHFVVKTKARETGLNVYAIWVAPSGAGKSSVDNVISRGLNTAGIPERLREKMPSAEGMHTTLAGLSHKSTCPTDGPYNNRSPAAMFMMDEVGKLTKGHTGGTGRAPTNADGVIDMLFTLFTRPAGDRALLAEETLAKSEREAVFNPYVQFGGLGTPGAYGASLTSDLIDAGFGNRVLHFMTDEATPEQLLPREPYPEHVRAALRAIHTGGHYVPRAGMDEVMGRPEDATWHRYQRYILLRDEDAAALKVEEKAIKAALRDEGCNPVIGERLAEQTIKIAGLMMMMQMTSDSMVLDDTPNWRIVDHDMRRDFLDFALALAKRQTMQFARWVASMADVSEEHKKAMKVLDRMSRLLKDPEGHIKPGSQDAKELPSLKRGRVSRSLFSRRLCRTAARERSAILDILMTEERIHEVTESDTDADGKSGPETVYYRLGKAR